MVDGRGRLPLDPARVERRELGARVRAQVDPLHRLEQPRIARPVGERLGLHEALERRRVVADHQLLDLGGLEEVAAVLPGVRRRAGEAEERLDELLRIGLRAEQPRDLERGERVARPEQRRLAERVDRVVGAAQAVLVEARDLEPEREAPRLVRLPADEREQRAPRLLVPAGLVVDAVAAAQRLGVGRVDAQRPIDQRERPVAIAEAAGRARRRRGAGGRRSSARVLGEIGLGLERAGELLVVPRALRVALHGEDRRAPPRLAREDPLELLHRARGLAELVLPDAHDLLQQAHPARPIGRDLRGLRVELEARAHAAGVALEVARGGREQRRERVEDPRVAGIDRPARAQVGDRLVAAAEVALRDVGGVEQRGDAHAHRPERVRLHHPGAHPILVPPEPLERAVEPLPRRAVVRVERERALGVVGRLIGAAEPVEHLRQVHVLLRDRLGGRGARAGEEGEPLLPHLGRLLQRAADLQQADQLGQDAPPARRVQRRARRGAGEEVRRVRLAGHVGARSRVGAGAAAGARCVAAPSLSVMSRAAA